MYSFRMQECFNQFVNRFKGCLIRQWNSIYSIPSPVKNWASKGNWQKAKCELGKNLLLINLAQFCRAKFRLHFAVQFNSPVHHRLLDSRGGFLKIISVIIPTYAGTKTDFHADVSPRNWFSCRHRSEIIFKKPPLEDEEVFFQILPCTAPIWSGPWLKSEVAGGIH